MILVANDTIFSPTTQKRMVQFKESKGQSYNKIDAILYVSGKLIVSVCHKKTGASSF